MKDLLSPFGRRVTLKQLRAFEALAEAGTITAAAELLHLTPQAVGLRLRQLERAAGIPLTDRIDGRVRLTRAGREVLASARRVDRAVHECGSILAELGSGDRGRVALGVVSTGKYFAPRAVARFLEENPAVELQLQVGNRSDTMAALESGGTDLAITGRPPADFPVSADAIGDHPHIVIAPPDHPLVGRDDVRLTDLAREPVLLREEGSGTRALVRKLFETTGAPPNRMEIGSNETIKQAVMAGLGIALISAHTVAPELEDGRLAVLEAEGLPIVRQWYVVRRADRRLLPAASALRSFLAREGSSFLPTFPVATRRGA